MEEDIFIIKSFLKDKEMLLKHPCWISEKTVQAIENLINKYKEQEKIIRSMAEYMATHKYIGYDFEHAFPQEIIEEFKKKAKGD